MSLFWIILASYFNVWEYFVGEVSSLQVKYPKCILPKADSQMNLSKQKSLCIFKNWLSWVGILRSCVGVFYQSVAKIAVFVIRISPIYYFTSPRMKIRDKDLISRVTWWPYMRLYTVSKVMKGSLHRRLWNEKNKMADNIHVAMESSGDQFVPKLYNDQKRHVWFSVTYVFKWYTS